MLHNKLCPYVDWLHITDGTVVCSGGGSIVQPATDPLPSVVIGLCEGINVQMVPYNYPSTPPHSLSDKNIQFVQTMT